MLSGCGLLNRSTTLARHMIQVSRVLRGRSFDSNIVASVHGLISTDGLSSLGPLPTTGGVDSVMFIHEGRDGELSIQPNGGGFWRLAPDVFANNGVYDQGTTRAFLYGSIASTNSLTVCPEDVPTPPHSPEDSDAGALFRALRFDGGRLE